MKQVFIAVCFFFPAVFCFSQSEKDSLDAERLARMISLSEVVMRSDLNVAKFVDRIKKDTTFYKAFRSLHLVGFTSLNDIRMFDKKNRMVASLQSKTKQNRHNNCRTMQVLEEKTTGNFYNKHGKYNYYTAEMYAGLFFTSDTICHENNVVKGIELNPKAKSGMEKRKEQLKMLFFNPGRKIPGIPFIGDKIDIFDPQRAMLYDFSIDYADYEGQPCYIFSIAAKQGLPAGEKNKIVIDKMITWFHARTMEIMQRHYHLSYNTGVYDFDVSMQVQMTRFGEFLVPKTLRYQGAWNVVFRKRERGTFTATLFDFEN